jgi:hypothetical protein
MMRPETAEPSTTPIEIVDDSHVMASVRRAAA